MYGPTTRSTVEDHSLYYYSPLIAYRSPSDVVQWCYIAGFLKFVKSHTIAEVLGDRHVGVTGPLNKYVFKRVLKLSMFFAHFITWANSFQSFEAQVENALSPYFLVLVFGCATLCFLSDRRDLMGT